MLFAHVYLSLIVICIILEVMKKAIAIILALVLATGLTARPVAAAPSEEVIRASCQAAQSVLNQIEKTDAALRINRGRVYSEVLDLFYAMNARLASNKVSAPKLVSITSDFDQRLTDFRDNYNDYDDELNKLIELQCQKKPTDFYSQLDSVRQLRDQLNNDIQQLDQLIDDYESEFNDNVRGLING